MVVANQEPPVPFAGQQPRDVVDTGNAPPAVAARSLRTSWQRFSSALLARSAMVLWLALWLVPTVANAQSSAVKQQSPAADPTSLTPATQSSVTVDAAAGERVLVAPAVETSTQPGFVTVSKASVLVGSFTVFLLAVFVGFEIITKVPPTLHTPLMSGSNAISGITVVGAMLTAGSAVGGFGSLLGLLAVVLATVNVVGGFLVTHRMLMMFKKR